MSFQNRVVQNTFLVLSGEATREGTRDSIRDEVLDTRLETLSPSEACQLWDSFVSALIRHGLSVRIGKVRDSEEGSFQSATFIDGKDPLQIFIKEVSGEEGPELRLFLKAVRSGEIHELAASSVLEDPKELAAWVESLLGRDEDLASLPFEEGRVLKPGSPFEKAQRK